MIHAPAGGRAATGDTASPAPAAAAGPAIRFPNGLFGFPEVERFELEHLRGGPEGLKILRCAEDRSLGFLVLPYPQESGLLAAADVEAVREGLTIAANDLLVLLVVTSFRGRDGLRLFANLRAPLFIDAQARLGAQVVLADPGYPLRHPLQHAA